MRALLEFGKALEFGYHLRECLFGGKLQFYEHIFPCWSRRFDRMTYVFAVLNRLQIMSTCTFFAQQQSSSKIAFFHTTFLSPTSTILRNSIFLKFFMINYITYTFLHIFTQVLFWAGSHGNHHNWVPSVLSNRFWLIFMGMKQRNWELVDSKKMSFSNPPIFNFGTKHANLKKLTQTAAWMWLNLDGCQAVRKKVILVLKMHLKWKSGLNYIMGWHRWDSIFMITMVSIKFLGVRINLLYIVLPQISNIF